MNKIKEFKNKFTKNKLIDRTHIYPIAKKELLFDDEHGEETLNTKVILDDYEWVDYKMLAHFTTKKQGNMSVLFNFYGFKDATMFVAQTTKDWRYQMTGDEILDAYRMSECIKDTTRYRYEFPMEIFKKYMMRFLEEQLKSWDDKAPAFEGAGVFLDFFNEVVENYEPKIFNPNEDGEFPEEAFPASASIG